MSALTLNLELIRARRLAVDMSARQIADELGIAEGTYRRLETGIGPWEILSVAHMRRLAEVLGCHLVELFSDPTAPTDECGTDLVPQIGSLLLTADRGVTPAALAEVCRTDTAHVQRALGQLRDLLKPAGLTVSSGEHTLTLVPLARPQSAAATRELLRRADARGAVLAPAARLLQRAARGTLLSRVQSRGERQQMSRALNAGWLRATSEDQRSLKAQLELSPDVQFSLLLDDGLPLESATATATEPVQGRREFDWMAWSDEAAPDPTEHP